MKSVFGSPFLIPGDASLEAQLSEFTERVETLRAAGTLTSATLERYFGKTRIEQVAESNALEGSPLSVGETELAVEQGITLAGHDPAWSRDAQALARALQTCVELARNPGPVRWAEVRALHEELMGDRDSAGVVRNHEVRISGSAHKPPRTRRDILDQLDQWDAWSRANIDTHALIRAAVLHTWFEQIHPFSDGNGRAGRAMMNLDLIRRGYPSVIIRTIEAKHRTRYLEALAAGDEGDLGPMIELLGERVFEALNALERAAREGQGFDRLAAKARQNLDKQREVWNAHVALLVAGIKAELDEIGVVQSYESLDLDTYARLVEHKPAARTWAFKITADYLGTRVSLLAWVGFASPEMRTKLGRDDRRPVLHWSVPSEVGYPPWRRASTAEAPFGTEMTVVRDRWVVLSGRGAQQLSSAKLAKQIAEGVERRILPSSSL